MRIQRCDGAPDEAAPRITCSCRSCYVARRNSLDPRLVDLIRVPSIGPSNGLSRATVERKIDHYLAGRLEWAVLYIEIIELLLVENERLSNSLLRAASLAPSPASQFLATLGKGDVTDG